MAGQKILTTGKPSVHLSCNDCWQRCIMLSLKEKQEKFIDRVYNYEKGEVLFKPTLARDIQFRNTKEAALSYFVGNNSNYSEDSGFALKNWTSIRWDNSGIQVFENIAVAMGNYYFTNSDGTIMVEFSFVYKKCSHGELKIILHDSHLPYQK